jgi:hypothetical protein
MERADIRLAGRPLNDVRIETRAAFSGLDANVPLIGCGHQPDFAHPGVWAKHVVVRHVAETLGCGAFDLVVDNDSPRSMDLTIPVVDASGRVDTNTVRLGSSTAGAAHEGRPAIPPEEIETLRGELRALLGSRWDESMLPKFMDGLARPESPVDAVEQHLDGRRHLDSLLGAELPEFRISRYFGGAFVAELLIEAERFAGAYNASLHDYRREQGVRDIDRPLPDLHADDSRIETAFWIYRPQMPRRRLWVRSPVDRIELLADAEHVGTLEKADLVRDPQQVLDRLRPWVIRPRALTLTLWARLLLCDLFVHGIGGAKYDRITDGIFRRYFEIEPPAYACVSATRTLDLPRHHVTFADVAAARTALRDLHYNPQRHLSDLPGDLVAERSSWIQRSDELRETQGPSLERREVYRAIQRVNARLIECVPEAAERMRERVAALDRLAESDRIAVSRAYFYALEPHDRLADLAGRLRTSAALSG